MKKTIEYSAKGYVLGNYWGGGKGAYPTIQFEGKTHRLILAKAKVALLKGTIDSGMGFESLIGAVLVIKRKTIINIKGEEYVNEKLYLDFVGEMTKEEIDFLERCCLNIW